ncbi:Protein disulfide-isomerase tmx3, variant 2, partial [Schistosoma haematobium]
LEKEIELEKLRRQKRGGSDQSVSNSENTILKNLYLPKRKVLRFDGTPTNYWNFIRNFEECIGSENIGFRAKLNYLIQYCDGEAKAAILHCTILEPKIGYHQALKLLEETFGPKHVIARTFIDNLLNFPNIRRNQPDGLRRLSREMQACSLTLEQMNYVTDLNSSRTIETMVLKLPTHIQQEWLKVAYKIIRGGREPLFTDLVEFVKEQAEIANTRYGLLVTGDPSNRNQRQSMADTKRHFDSGYKASVVR